MDRLAEVNRFLRELEFLTNLPPCNEIDPDLFAIANQKIQCEVRNLPACTLTYRNASPTKIYVGQTCNDKAHGIGVVTVTGLYDLVIKFDNGLMHGAGKLSLLRLGIVLSIVAENNVIKECIGIRSEGFEYHGPTTFYMANGKGVAKSADYVYEGEFLLGLRHGTGVWRRVGPSQNPNEVIRYEGDYILGEITGFGKTTHEVGTYTGTLVKGIFEGYGEYVRTAPVSPQEQKKVVMSYKGNYHKGLQHGFGTAIYSDGTSYRGTFKSNLPEGAGIYKNVKGTAVGNTGRDGLEGHIILQLNGELRYHGGMKKVSRDNFGQSIIGKFIYSGNFLGGRFHGDGLVSTLIGKVVFDGAFINNLPHGQGKYYCKDFEYVGEFVNGLAHGKGVAKFKDGSQLDGNYCLGFPVGLCSMTLPNKTVIPIMYPLTDPRIAEFECMAYANSKLSFNLKINNSPTEEIDPIMKRNLEPSVVEDETSVDERPRKGIKLEPLYDN